MLQEKPAQRDMGPARPPSRLGSAQPYGRAINQPQPNPAKPPKRGLEDETRPAPRKPSATIHPSGEAKRRRTDEEQNPMAMRPTMAPPIRQSNIRKVRPICYVPGSADSSGTYKAVVFRPPKFSPARISQDCPTAETRPSHGYGKIYHREDPVCGIF